MLSHKPKRHHKPSPQRHPRQHITHKHSRSSNTINVRFSSQKASKPSKKITNSGGFGAFLANYQSQTNQSGQYMHAKRSQTSPQQSQRYNVDNEYDGDGDNDGHMPKQTTNTRFTPHHRRQDANTNTRFMTDRYRTRQYDKNTKNTTKHSTDTQNGYISGQNNTHPSPLRSNTSRFSNNDMNLHDSGRNNNTNNENRKKNGRNFNNFDNFEKNGRNFDNFEKNTPNLDGDEFNFENYKKNTLNHVPNLHETLTVEITDLSHDGHGVAKLDNGYPIFVPSGLPGEKIEIVTTKIQKTYGHGKINKILSPSPSRITPLCKYFEQCGGCTMQHMNYQSQLIWKRKMVENVITRIAKINNPIIRPVIGMDEPWHYRNKAQVPIGIGINNIDSNSNHHRSQTHNFSRKSTNQKLISGFFSSRSHDVVDIDKCLISPNEVTPILTTLTEYLNTLHIQPYDESSHTGNLRHIIVRRGKHGQRQQQQQQDREHNDNIIQNTNSLQNTNINNGTTITNNDNNNNNDDLNNNQENQQVMVIMVTKTKHLPHHEKIVAKIREIIPNISSIYQNVNMNQTNTIMGDENFLLWGDETIQDVITHSPSRGGGEENFKENEQNEQNQQNQQNQQQKFNKNELIFEISPHSFFQVNPIQTQKLYQQALEYSGVTDPINKGKLNIIDAYCGVGSISLYFAPFVKHVYGVEIVNEAIIDARHNAKVNNLQHKTTFMTGKAEEIIPQWYKNSHFHADVLVVDPPRRGCDKALLDTIISKQIKRVVYVSCNPSTLARDIGALNNGGYSLKEIQPVDMFPHTYHCEAVAVLDYIGK